MTRSSPNDDHARREIARLLATWGVEEDPATSEIAAALEGSLKERARRAAATTPPPVPDPVAKPTPLPSTPPPAPQHPAAPVSESPRSAKVGTLKAVPGTPPPPTPQPKLAPASESAEAVAPEAVPVTPPKPTPAPAPAANSAKVEAPKTVPATPPKSAPAPGRAAKSAKVEAPKTVPATPPKSAPASGRAAKSAKVEAPETVPATPPKSASAPGPVDKAVEPDAVSASARELPARRVPVTRPHPRSKARRHTPPRAWVFLLAPVILAGFLLAALAAWNAGPAMAEVLIGLEQESPRAMELLLVSPNGASSVVATFDKGVQQLRLSLPHGSYELYLDGRYSGVQISVPMQTQTALPVPPERGARPGEASAHQREALREREDE